MIPKVTVLVPVWNTRGDWLWMALSGLCRQDYPNLDVCIGDNGSTAASTLLIEKLAQEKWPDRIRIGKTLPGEANRGTARGLDAAMAMSDPETAWFCKADSDDMFSKEWISARMKAAEALPPQVAIIYDNYLQLNYEPRPHIVPVILRPYDYRALLESSYIPGPSMYRASVYEKIPGTYVYPGYDGKANRHGEDYNHWLAITDYFDGYWLDCDPALTWTYRFYQKSKYNSDRKGVDYARTMLQQRAKERRGLA